MTSTSSVSASLTATTTSNRRRAWVRRSGMILLAASSGVASLAVFSAGAQALQLARAGPLRAASVLLGQNSTPPSAASTFCAHVQVSKVSSIVGTTVSLFETAVKNSNLECIYFGKSPASVSHPIDEVVISTQPDIAPAKVPSTLAKAEAGIVADTPKGVKLILTPLRSVGPTAFSWTYAQAENGGQLVGIADYKGTTGYGAVVGGAAKTFGTAAGHVPVLEHLLALDMAA